jgi:hypothetical protein
MIVEIGTETAQSPRKGTQKCVFRCSVRKLFVPCAPRLFACRSSSFHYLSPAPTDWLYSFMTLSWTVASGAKVAVKRGGGAQGLKASFLESIIPLFIRIVYNTIHI